MSFAATAGVEYWLSIVAIITTPPTWGWATGTGGNENAYQTFQGTLVPQYVDLAFTLSGNVAATPLPSTWTMLIAGFVGLGFFAYRGTKKNTAAIAAA